MSAAMKFEPRAKLACSGCGHEMVAGCDCEHPTYAPLKPRARVEAADAKDIAAGNPLPVARVRGDELGVDPKTVRSAREPKEEKSSIVDNVIPFSVTACTVDTMLDHAKTQWWGQCSKEEWLEAAARAYELGYFRLCRTDGKEYKPKKTGATS